MEMVQYTVRPGNTLFGIRALLFGYKIYSRLILPISL